MRIIKLFVVSLLMLSTQAKADVYKCMSVDQREKPIIVSIHNAWSPSEAVYAKVSIDDTSLDNSVLLDRLTHTSRNNFIKIVDRWTYEGVPYVRFEFTVSTAFKATEIKTIYSLDMDLSAMGAEFSEFKYKVLLNCSSDREAI